MNASQDFDWNLLKCLEALLLEHNVTRAAARLGLSQPAMSRSLARLRDVFQDELLVRSGRGMEPTVRAENLLAMLQTVREQVSDAVAARNFDPRKAKRTFTVCGADFAEITLVPALMRILTSEAPGISLRFLHSSVGPEELLLDRNTDIVLNPRLRSSSPHVVGHKLFDEAFACIVRKGHPQVKRRLTLKRYCGLAHLLIAPRGQPGGIVDGALEKMGQKRHVALLVPSFLSAPQIIASTDLIATLPARLAHLFAKVLPLQILHPPLDVPGFSMMQYWSITKSEDPAHQFLRSAVARAALTVG